MANTVYLGLALALSQAPDPHVIESHAVQMTEPLSGPDLLLISEAARHPEMRGRDLDCYRIYILTENGVRTVAFLGIREEQPPKKGEVFFPPQNPRCPDRSFVMGENRRVVRVIYSRH